MTPNLARILLVAIVAFFLGGVLAEATDVNIPPELLYTLVGIVVGFGSFAAASYAASRASGERARYKSTPSTDDDEVGEERARRWDAIHDALVQANALKALQAFFDQHESIEGAKHGKDKR